MARCASVRRQATSTEPFGAASYVKMEIKEQDMTEEEIERIVRRQA